MKFKKFIAAASAVTMLGALTAVPSFAADETGDIDSVTVTPTWDTYFRYNNTNNFSGNDTVEVHTSSDGNTDFVGALKFKIPETPEGKKISSVSLKLITRKIVSGSTYNIAVFDDSKWTKENTAYSAVVDEISAARKSEPIASFKPNGQNNKALTDSGLNDSNKNLEAWTNVISLSSTVVSPSEDLSLIIYESDNANRSFYFYSSNTAEKTFNGTDITIPADDLVPQLTITYADADKVPAEDISIATNYEEGQVLYQNESIDLSAVVSPSDSTDSVTWSIIGEDGKDYYTDNSWFTIADGKLIYKKNDRAGGISGKVTITATAGDKSASLDILTQRLRNTSYKITDNSGKAPDMTVETKVNGEIKTDKTSGNVSYDSAVATGNNYSGNSTFEMTFTVPDGYKLTTTRMFDGLTETTEGNKVIYSSSTDIHNDFYIEAALEKIETPADIKAEISNAAVYTGNDNSKALGFITTVTSDKEASVQKLTWKVTGHESDFTYTPAAAITLGENTDVYFGVIINGYDGDVVPAITANAE